MHTKARLQYLCTFKILVPLQSLLSCQAYWHITLPCVIQHSYPILCSSTLLPNPYLHWSTLFMTVRIHSPHYPFLIISKELMFKVVLLGHVAYGAKVVVTATGTLPTYPTHHVFPSTAVTYHTVMKQTCTWHKASTTDIVIGVLNSRTNISVVFS